jgi:hypothetical protein
VKLHGLLAVDKRTATVRDALAFKAELVSALGGEDQVSPQKAKLIELASRASMLLDHVDAWILSQETLIKDGDLLPVVFQRQLIADHLSKTLLRIGLDRKPRPALTLAQIVALEKQRETREQPEPDPSHVAEPVVGTESIVDTEAPPAVPGVANANESEP